MNKTKNLSNLVHANDYVASQKDAPAWAHDLRDNKPPNRLRDYEAISMQGAIKWKDREENATTWFKDSGVVADDYDNYSDDQTRRNMVL
jgi:hypothetical protein